MLKNVGILGGFKLGRASRETPRMMLQNSSAKEIVNSANSAFPQEVGKSSIYHQNCKLQSHITATRSDPEKFVALCIKPMFHLNKYWIQVSYI